MMDLSQKRILITGASSGIGRACAVAAAAMGATVILTGRNEERLRETLSLLQGEGHFLFTSDVTDMAAFEAQLESCVAQSGPVSGFIHSAGIEMTRPLQTMSAPLYQSVFATNVIAAFEIARLLSKKKYVDPLGASFVFISSVMAVRGQAGKVAYCSSKSALSGGAKAIALELASKKIRVNCVLPAMVETEMAKKMFESLPESSVAEIIKQHPLGLGKPEDVALACIFLLSNGARWITGTELVVDGGYQIA